VRNCQVDLSQVDYAANLVSIACIAADGFDRVYTVSVNEMTRFGGFIKIYRASLDGSQVLAVCLQMLQTVYLAAFALQCRLLTIRSDSRFP
jgi:hypothetical protein